MITIVKAIDIFSFVRVSLNHRGYLNSGLSRSGFQSET